MNMCSSALLEKVFEKKVLTQVNLKSPKPFYSQPIKVEGGPGAILNNGSKFIGYPGRDHRQWGEDFFSENIRGAETFFRKKSGGAETFFRKKLGGRRRFSEKN